MPTKTAPATLQELEAWKAELTNPASPGNPVKKQATLVALSFLDPDIYDDDLFWDTVEGLWNKYHKG